MALTEEQKAVRRSRFAKRKEAIEKRMWREYDRAAEQFSREELVEPCPHPPGSEEKLRILAARYRRGLPLYAAGDNALALHPIDARRGDV